MPPSVYPWAARFKFAQEMLPFISELSLGCAECDATAPRTNLVSIERIPALFCLNRHHSKICVDCSTRRCMRAKTRELGMMAVSLRRASEYCACEQPLSPECYQTLGVEILWMECPETHVGHLTVKFRGRAQAPPKRHGRTLTSGARGA